MTTVVLEVDDSGVQVISHHKNCIDGLKVLEQMMRLNPERKFYIINLGKAK